MIYGRIWYYKQVTLPRTVYEPWHFRYVGVEHAKKINELGYCLEEYIEYLDE